MKHLIVLPILLLGISVSSHAQTVLPGSQIEVRAGSPITVSLWDRGRRYVGYVAHDVYDRDGNVAIPAGSQAEFVVRQTGYDQVSLDVDSVIVNGNRYSLNAAGVEFNVPHGQFDTDAALSSAMNSISTDPGSRVYVEVRGGELLVPGGALIHSTVTQPMRYSGWNDPGYGDSGSYYNRPDSDYR